MSIVSCGVEFSMDFLLSTRIASDAGIVDSGVVSERDVPVVIDLLTTLRLNLRTKFSSLRLTSKAVP